ncbi:MAG TPA: pilus assembly protein TadG-related protein [Myxococcota bacterium]
MVIVLGALVTLIAMASLAIDVGVLWAARTQLQNAADAAALAGAMNLIDTDGPSVTADLARVTAVDVASRNCAASVESLTLDAADVAIGRWALDTRTFDAGVDLSDPDQVSAVSVRTRLDAASNGPVPAIFSRVLGREAFSVAADATAYLGFAGGVGPGEIELPIVIDCCKLRGSDCQQDFCEYVATSPPNPCDLESPQDDGISSVSCLEFHATDEQNACWTQFDEQDPSINARDLRDIIEAGNPVDISTQSSIYLDNGDKASVIQELSDRFYGHGTYSNSRGGTDRYAPFDGVSDSWVRALSVVECQTGDGCATGSSARVVGFVCVEIREVETSPLNIIRTRFLCPSDPLFDECDIGRTTGGGLDFGVRADIPVLVQ